MRSGTFITLAAVAGAVLAAPLAGDNTAPADNAPANTPPAATAPAGADLDTGRPDRAWVAASCDEHDQPFDVEPDTPEAWAEATTWCARSGEAIRTAPWPSGFTPAPLPWSVGS